MSDVKKYRIFENRQNRKEVVKIMDVVGHAISASNSKIVVFKQVQPILKSSIAMNGQFLEFDEQRGIKKEYLPIEEFEQNYRWFVEDEETQVRLREGFYDNN